MKQQWLCSDCLHYRDGTTIVETAVKTVKGGPEIWTAAPMYQKLSGQWEVAGCEHGRYPNCKGSSEPRGRALTPGCDGQRPEGWEPRE